jgi:membrane protein YqaA with SNARE-associated domain
MSEHPVREVIHEVSELEREALPPSPALPPLPIPEIASGKIFLFLLAFYATAILIRISLIEGPTFISTLKHIAEPGYTVQPSGSILFGFFFYMCVACTFFPIPTLPPIAFAAKIFDPVLIAALGAAGTCIANLNDYAILGWMFRHHKVKKIRDAKTYRKLLDYFDRYAFLTLSVATFLPIPIDVVRLLAISRAYPYVRYVLATFAGRFPRYLILAYLGRELPAKYILILFVITIIPAAYKLASDMIKKRKRRERD